MFTGIVEELGEIADVEQLTAAARFTVRAPLVTSDARPGDSIAVSGVCLTVVEVTGDSFTVDVMQQTLERSSLGGLRPGDRVNLERAATLATRLGGHLVQGHVDAVGFVLDRGRAEHWETLRIGLPPGLTRYVVAQGSVAVDGVSLTVAELTDSGFAVSLIPTTLAQTTLGGVAVGDRVNVEVDVVAKYVEKLLVARGGGNGRDGRDPLGAWWQAPAREG
jgi:riboflavin synthase